MRFMVNVFVWLDEDEQFDVVAHRDQTWRVIYLIYTPGDDSVIAYGRRTWKGGEVTKECRHIGKLQMQVISEQTKNWLLSEAWQKRG